MTLYEAMQQNEGLTNPRFLKLAFQAVKTVGKAATVEMVYKHILDQLKHPENITSQPENVEQLKTAIEQAKQEA